MDERRQRALKKYHQRLRTGLLVGNFLPVLRLLLTEVEYSRVDGRDDNIARVDELIEILLTKENKHFDGFCSALEENGYEHWARTLGEEVGVEGSNSVSNGSQGNESDATELANSFEDIGKTIVFTQELSTSVQTLTERALTAGEIKDEDIKHTHQVRTAQHDLIFVAEKAFVFLDKVDNLAWYCMGDTMTEAREELCREVRHVRDLVPADSARSLPEHATWDILIQSLRKKLFGASSRSETNTDNPPHTPEIRQLRDLLGLLECSLAQAESSYLDFVDACNTASRSCGEAANVCARKAREACNKKTATHSGNIVVAVVMQATAGIAIGTAVMTGFIPVVALLTIPRLSCNWAKSEASFQRIKREFDSLERFALELKEGWLGFIPTWRIFQLKSTASLTV